MQLIECGKQVCLCLRIADTDIGISEEDLSHVWERLYRTDPARTRIQGGSGLGLAIVKKVVDLHVGQTSMINRQGQGTVVEISIPIAGPRQGRGEEA